jgi:beta-glucanase (GH16 family)
MSLKFVERKRSRRDGTYFAPLVAASFAAAAFDPASRAHGQAIAAPAGMEWSNTYSDQFNNGASDLSGWTYDIGNGGPSNPGWGNDEQEYYTNSTNNVSVSGGALNITAIASPITQGTSTYQYTSGRIQTSSLFSQTYGLFEFRAKMPAGTGLWPALWLYPQNSTYGGWPNSGEIDVVESKGQQTTLVQGSLHSGPNSGSDDTQTAEYSAPGGFSTTAYHTYDLFWEPANSSDGEQNTIKWYVDGNLYETIHSGWIVPPGGGGSGSMAPFNEPFFIILDLAVGGTYGGTPALTSGASYTMSVDYITAYQLAVPEPASAALLAGSAFALGVRRPRRTRPSEENRSTPDSDSSV